MSKPKKKVVKQNHHLRYMKDCGEDWTVPVRKMEHYYITCISRFKELSKGAKLALAHIIVEKPDYEWQKEEEKKTETKDV